MAINPIQLPVWKDVPQLDFKGLDAIGDSFGAYRQRGALADNLPAMLGVEQPQQGNSLATLGQPQPPAAPQGAPSAPGSNASAIAGIESGGNYSLLGPVIAKGAYAGDRAYGKYQVMGKNVPEWTQEVLGRPMTPQEFLASPQAQDAVFNAKFGQLAQKYGPEGAARAWFAGEGGMNDMGRKDQLGTSVASYSRQFLRNGGGEAPTALAFNGPNPPIPAQPGQQPAPAPTTFADRFAAVMPGSQSAQPQSASVSSQPGGASVQPSQVAPAAQPQPQQVAQAPQAAPGAPVSSPIPPETMARLQAMIRAGGPAQAFAMALLQKYVVPQTPVVVNEGGIAFNPVTGAVIARGQSKSYPVAAGGALVTPGAPGAQGGAGAAPVYTNENGKLDAQTLKGMARRYLETGDNQIITDAGNGTMGAVNRAALMNEIETMRAQTGKSGADIVGAKGDSGNQVKSIENFGTGPQGNTVRSLNVAVDHLALLRNLAREMASSGGRSDFRPTNALVNEWNKVFGSALPTNVEAAKHIVAAEITKAITGSQGALGDREELAAPLATANSWEQLSGVIDKAYTPLMAGQLKGLRQQYVTSTKKSEGDFNNMLSDRTRSALEGKGLQGEQPAPPKVTSYSEVSQSLSNAKAAISRGAPRDAVIKRLIDAGVPKEMANKL